MQRRPSKLALPPNQGLLNLVEKSLKKLDKSYRPGGYLWKNEVLKGDQHAYGLATIQSISIGVGNPQQLTIIGCGATHIVATDSRKETAYRFPLKGGGDAPACTPERTVRKASEYAECYRREVAELAKAEAKLVKEGNKAQATALQEQQSKYNFIAEYYSSYEVKQRKVTIHLKYNRANKEGDVIIPLSFDCKYSTINYVDASNDCLSASAAFQAWYDHHRITRDKIPDIIGQGNTVLITKGKISHPLVVDFNDSVTPKQPLSPGSTEINHRYNQAYYLQYYTINESAKRMRALNSMNFSVDVNGMALLAVLFNEVLFNKADTEAIMQKNFYVNESLTQTCRLREPDSTTLPSTETMATIRAINSECPIIYTICNTVDEIRKQRQQQEAAKAAALLKPQSQPKPKMPPKRKKSTSSSQLFADTNRQAPPYQVTRTK